MPGLAHAAVVQGVNEDTIFIFTADYPADFPILMDREWNDSRILEKIRKLEK